ncbi:tropinone reductase homolog At5g06060-like isoform X3 [Nicotiana sylvestris]|uniref:Tropinone reductase homolog At5g06060-like isoform X3 n=1 Tax=Nicotiana tabacum TaxID=4097 RepID=A0A1S4DGT2_TOBAC|nr:PREDICTED: tropinone reductase homolog At5g06060-like isoform X3 [Nicotiana tabacum]
MAKIEGFAKRWSLTGLTALVDHWWHFWNWINNVGTSITVEYTTEDYAHIFATNYESSFHLCQIAHPLLKASGAGIIVFNSSASSLVHVSGTSIYRPTKAAMNQLTRHLACEWAKDGIRVNGVVPWFINTPLVEHEESLGATLKLCPCDP